MNKKQDYNILFLHHSTGMVIWKGGVNKYIYRLTKKGEVEKLFSNYNRKNKTQYTIHELTFPKKVPYGWNNYPFDYYNIWVKNAGNKQFMEEPTLEILTKKYDLIIFKHCFPVSNIENDIDSANIDSDYKSLPNYKLQYKALKEKMYEFPDTKFLIWTPASLVKNQTNEEKAKRIKEFHSWIINSWDEPNDNIFLWDFYSLETEGDIYLKSHNARNDNDSHPNINFAQKVAPLFVNRIIQVIENIKTTKITGEN